MFKISDIFILVAVGISFVISGVSYFSGLEMQALFTAIWVPTILIFGIYFKLSAFIARYKKNIARDKKNIARGKKNGSR